MISPITTTTPSSSSSTRNSNQARQRCDRRKPIAAVLILGLAAPSLPRSAEAWTAPRTQIFSQRTSSTTGAVSSSSSSTARFSLSSAPTTPSTSSSSSSSTSSSSNSPQHAGFNNKGLTTTTAVAEQRRRFSGDHGKSSVLSAVSIGWDLDLIHGDEHSNSASHDSWAIKTRRSPSALADFIKPVLSAAMLMTGNTVGAGCLVLPEMTQGPGLAATSAIFLLCYIINLFSGLVIADISVRQQQQQATSGSETPASFVEFAQVNMQNHPVWVPLIAAISLFTNACILAFDISRAGAVGSTLMQGWVPPAGVSVGWALLLASLLSTQSSDKLSHLASFLVTALFLTFGCLLVPGLAAVPMDLPTLWAQPGLVSEGGAWWDSVSALAPVALMSMVYQNIVPTVVKMLNYDRTQVIAALSLGSAIPLCMYLAWIYANLGGGMDMASLWSGDSLEQQVLLAAFSMITLGGSTLGSGLSLSEEVTTLLSSSRSAPPVTASSTTTTTTPAGIEDVGGAFSPVSAAAAVSLPLLFALFCGQPDMMTLPLTLAGSFGSPLLYGVIPAVMAWQQRRPVLRPPVPESSNERGPSGLVPTFSLPVLGLLSTGFFGQEMASRLTEMFSVV